MDLDFDVAKSDAVVPRVPVVGGPEDDVDEVEEEQDDEPGDEGGGADVAVAEVPEHGREDEEHSDETEGGEEDAGGVDMVGGARRVLRNGLDGSHCVGWGRYCAVWWLLR